MFSSSSKLSKTAAKWFLRMQETTADSTERSQFEAWLMQSPQHQQEYATISDAWHGIDSLDELAKLAEAKQSNHQMTQQKRSKTIKNIMGAMSACFIVGFVGLVGHQQYQLWQASPTLQLASQSKIAQIVTQTLDDGSQITLNASSQIQVTYYRNQRHIDLIKGEAIFNVEKDPNRPFIVETNTAKITVLGTRFAVNKLSNIVRVSVDHGRVQVESKGKQSKLIIQNGQVAEIPNGQAVQPIDAQAADYFKFTTGTVVFNQAPMAEIAEVLSRYRQKNVITQGHSPDKISAVFNVKDTETFINTLPKIANVSLANTAQNTIIKDNKTLPP
jgi:transmembrane sensor